MQRGAGLSFQGHPGIFVGAKKTECLDSVADVSGARVQPAGIENAWKPAWLT